MNWEELQHHLEPENVGTAPLGVKLDTLAELEQWADKVHELTVVTRTMPLANLTHQLGGGKAPSDYEKGYVTIGDIVKQLAESYSVAWDTDARK